MIISRSKKALILRLRDPERVLSVIPRSKKFTYDGKEYVAVKHGVEEVQVLRNIGIEAPSPIKYYYDWPGRFKPYNHQIETAAFLTFYNRAFNLNDLGCVDSETEYLSPTGWVRIADYAGGKVAQYHPDTGTAEFVEPTEFVKLPCDTMIRVKTKYGVDQLLSPEHRMVIRDRERPGKVEVVQAIDLMRRQEDWLAGVPPKLPFNRKLGKPDIAYSGAAVPAAFAVDGVGPGVALSEAELRVQIAVIADGHFSKSNTTRCAVRLKKERKKLRLRALLTDAGIPWKEREQNTATAQGFTVFSFYAPVRVKEFDSRFWAATVEQLCIVCDEVMHWDGSEEDYRTAQGKGKRFSTFVKATADFVQYAYSATGHVARLLEHRRDRRGATEIEYVVQVRVVGSINLQLKGTGADGKRRSMTWAPSTDGFKYCFMVPSTFLVLRRNGCVFCTGNTGKTISTLWAYDFLKAQRLVGKVLVITPLSTMNRTWADECFQHFPHLEVAVLYGDGAKRLKLLNTDADIYVINHDGIKINGFVEAMAKRPDIDLIIVDELAQIGRNAGTDRFKALTTIVNRQHPRKAWGLTGAPIPNAPTDAWAQCRLLVPERVPGYFGKFKDLVMRQVTQYLWVPRPTALDTVYEVMQPAIRFHRDECIDLPPCVFETRQVELSAGQARAYKDMLTKLKAESENGEITAVNEAVKAQKLIQIACGVAYGNDGSEVVFDAGPRMAAVLEIIEESSSKAIVFVPFVPIVTSVADYLRQHGVTVECIYGEVPKSERDSIFTRFQKTASPRVIVATPGTMSHGLTLTAASTIIWVAPTTSADTFVQANARITRPGQKHSQLIVMIEGTKIEEKYYRRLKDKESVQGTLLDLVKDSRVES